MLAVLAQRLDTAAQRRKIRRLEGRSAIINSGEIKK